jgi:hypothetical protein
MHFSFYLDPEKFKNPFLIAEIANNAPRPPCTFKGERRGSYDTCMLGNLGPSQNVDDLDFPSLVVERRFQFMQVLFCPTGAGRVSSDIKSEHEFGHGGVAL